MSFENQKIIKAVLGTTNTGKTFYAVDRMLAYKSGIIGFPLRLLAREIYEKIITRVNKDIVALITGEERIIPKNPKFWICTVEAMPTKIKADFLAIDEIQLCIDRERGHVFTEKLLYARGNLETIFIGSETIKNIILQVVPNAQIIKRNRFSKLIYSGKKKISKIPERSAVVTFSIDQVYAIAEIIRRKKGGAAVVMGALSPRTRNAQVELYQNGEVDYLVATDAIGMGLNLDIKHVAFSKISKFDGEKERLLFPSEIGQIAGRAGRYVSDGTFGVTGNVDNLNLDLTSRIENGNFSEIKFIQWRNNFLDFSSLNNLIFSLESQPKEPFLIKSAETEDQKTLKSLIDQKMLDSFTLNDEEIFLLWEVCKIPDFRKLSYFEHSKLIFNIFNFLIKDALIPNNWLHQQMKQIDKVDGDIDTLSKRISYVRTLTYISNKKGWTKDQDFWQSITRELEDKLSDVLHQRLIQNFVDIKTSVLSRSLKQRENLVAEINEKNEVFVEGQLIGRLEGFIFQQEKSSSFEASKTIKTTANVVLSSKYLSKSEKLYNSFDSEFDLTNDGKIKWQNFNVAHLVKGDHVLKPKLKILADLEAGNEVFEKILKRITLFLDRLIFKNFEPLFKMKDDEKISGLEKGVAYQIFENLGVIPKENIIDDIKSLDQSSRSKLRKHGVRFGQYTIYQFLMLKPHPTKLRLILTSVFSQTQKFFDAPSPGLVTIKAIHNIENFYYLSSGFRLFGNRAIRIDMLERLADLLRNENIFKGFPVKSDMLSITGLNFEDFSELMGQLGYEKIIKKTLKNKNEEDDEKRIKKTENIDLGEDKKTKILHENFLFKLKKLKQKNNSSKKSKKDSKNQKKLKDINNKGKEIDPDNPFSALMVLKRNK